MTEVKATPSLATDLLKLGPKLIDDGVFVKNLYSALTKSLWFPLASLDHCQEYTYKEAAGVIARLRNDLRGVSDAIVSAKEVGKSGVIVVERKDLDDMSDRKEGKDVVYLDELGHGDEIVMCACKHSKSAHDNFGQCLVRVKKETKDGETEFVQPPLCACDTYFGPEDYKDIIYCSVQGKISPVVRGELEKLGWRPVPKGAGFSKLRGILADAEGQKLLQDHCSKEFSSENFLFLQSVDQMKAWEFPDLASMADAKVESYKVALTKKVEEAKAIYEKFIAKGAPSEINLPAWITLKIRADITAIETNLPTLSDQLTKEISVEKKKRDHRQQEAERVKRERAELKKAKTKKDLGEKEAQTPEKCTLPRADGYHRLVVAPQPTQERIYHLFDEAEDEIYELIKRDTFVRFTKTDGYQKLSEKSASSRVLQRAGTQRKKCVLL